jgi:hypothetical protein
MAISSGRSPGATVAGCLCLALLSACGSNPRVDEERITERDGVISECGVGEDLPLCRDAEGFTYEEELEGPDVQAETNDELASDAAKIRNESPEELEKTITDLEQDANY